MARTAPVEPLLRHPAPPSPATGEPRTSAEAAAAPRRVLFADEALGLPLAQLRRYRPWGGPGVGKMAATGQDGGGGVVDEDDDGEDGDEGEEEEEPCPEPSPQFPIPADRGFYLVPTFSLPPALGRLERLGRVMVELEALLPPPGAVPGGAGVWVPGGRPPVLRGLVRVLNRSFEKAVHVRASHDGWASFYDHPARYVPRSPPGAGTGGTAPGDPILDPGLGLGPGQVSASSPDDGGRTDRFAFQLPFAEGAGDGARLDFVVRYETPEGTFWANNHGRNYTVLLRIAPAPTPTDAEGLPQQQQQLEPQPECQGPVEAEARQLKSCMKPVRRRPHEEELRMKSIDGNVPAVEYPDVQESVGPLVAPTPLRPWPQMTLQVSEVTVTGNSPEEGDIPRSSPPVAFTEVPQAPAIRIPPSSPLCGLGGSPRDQASGPDASEGAAGPLLEPSQQQVEATWEVSSENGGGPKAPVVGAIMDEPLGYLEVMSGLEELVGEDTIDQELEQLYLSHLSRLRAAVAAGGVGGGGEGPADGGVSPSHPLGILTDRDLILKWPCPERALNSALAEEITLHYARLGRGVELIKDTEDPDEEGEGEEGLSITPSSPEEDTPKESPPEILSGARSVVATMGDVWLPWAEGPGCDNPVVLGTEGQFIGDPDKGMGKDTNSLHMNRVIARVTSSPGEAVTKILMESTTECADSLVPISVKEPAAPVLRQGQKPSLLGPLGAAVCPSSLARPCMSSQDEEGSGPSLKPQKKSHALAAPAECVCVLPPQLRVPLAQTLGVLAGLVVVPVALNSGVSILVLVLCLSLAWFS
ncbi:protein phosphatase 1 regulatory subunit 3F isoform X2 [Elephas maximus indicus]|uniref:protein phosphatase 1 regulatory subunit 3F isoform X2 n=1 Tax=Elephas maximus indicus TaxID=99487 RepID=UPI0021170703|nr:protein phosphatase 1 regulatory subunit 3F isoform X2 [Elephas maximus indicus]